MFRKLFSVLMVLVFSLTAVVPAYAKGDDHGGHDVAGAVYVMTNAASGNQVIVYDRMEDGDLSYAGVYDTGGLGSGVGVTVPPDPLGSQDLLILAQDNRFLYAVNAGSNDISVFRVKGDELILTDRVPSGGDYPVSLTFNDKFLYVLNAAGEGSINGFLAIGGHLVPIKRSERSLEANTPADGAQPQILESPAQVGFSPDGQFLVITDKGGVSGEGRIIVFRMIKGAVPLPKAEITITSGAVPFSFVFDSKGHLVVTDAGATTVTSYDLDRHGALSEISTVVTGQAATCWIGTSGKYIFTDNTGASTISAIQSSRDGSLSLLNAVAADTSAGTLPLDLTITPNGRFLYTLQTGSGMVGMFHIELDGSLTSLGAVDGLSVVDGAQGIASR